MRPDPNYPRWMFHRSKPMTMVQNPEEEAALGPGWSRTPLPPVAAALPEEEKPKPQPQEELPDEDEEHDEEEDEEDSIARQEPAKVAAAPAPVPLKKRAPVRPPTKPKSRKK